MVLRNSGRVGSRRFTEAPWFNKWTKGLFIGIDITLISFYWVSLKIRLLPLFNSNRNRFVHYISNMNINFIVFTLNSYKRQTTRPFKSTGSLQLAT